MRRTLFGLATTVVLVLGLNADARAQYGYAAPPASARGYAFKDEPVMSINNSYLGYSNFVSYGRDPALGASTTYAASRAPAYYAPAPSRRGFRLFGWRRGYRY